MFGKCKNSLPLPGFELDFSDSRARNECYVINVPHYSGPGISVGIATDYGLYGPGSNPGGDEIIRPSRPALGPTQSPVK